MRILFFGTYDASVHPRVRVLEEGFSDWGDDVEECNIPLGIDTRARVELVRRPWNAASFGARLLERWARLVPRSLSCATPDAVVVGYLGHFDVHLARRLWPRTTLVLDHLIFAADTARDRQLGGRWTRLALEKLDQSAIRTADVVVVDTAEHAALVPEPLRPRTSVVPVGAPSSWFCEPRRRTPAPLRVVFFGLYTPLQGTQTIGEALDRLRDLPIEFTMIGSGQDFQATRMLARGNPNVRWIDWLSPEALPGVVREHDVCLGIFGAGPKALRVVPNKVYQAAASGCAVITSRTAPQVRIMGDACRYVAPNDPGALAGAIEELSRERDLLWELRQAAYSRARALFTPRAVVSDLRRAVAHASTRS